MSEELKACPFCGKPITDKDFCSGDGFPKGCDCIWETTTADESMKRWQSRPIEDALRTQLDELQKKYDAYRELMKVTIHVDSILTKQIKIAVDAIDGAIYDCDQFIVPHSRLTKAKEEIANLNAVNNGDGITKIELK